MVCSNHPPRGAHCNSTLTASGGESARHSFRSCQLANLLADESFIRPHPANDVHVTGTFDGWGKTEKLEKVGDVFEKEVTLPSADEKYYYKVRTLSGFGEGTIGY
jgi:hypothetical protein